MIDEKTSTRQDNSQFEISGGKHTQTESMTSNDAAVNTGKNFQILYWKILIDLIQLNSQNLQ